jgi:hypothetical protein
MDPRTPQNLMCVAVLMRSIYRRLWKSQIEKICAGHFIRLAAGTVGKTLSALKFWICHV